MAVTAEQLQPSDGVFRLSVTEPMDEVAYLDHLKLDVVDRPPGVSTTPDERFAPEGPRPTGELLAWRTAIEPVRATDLEGRDMTDILRHWDRRTVDTFRKRDGWIGYAEEHGIILDFGDRLEPLRPVGPARALPGRLGRIPLLADQLRGRDGRRRSQTAGDRAPSATTEPGKPSSPTPAIPPACPG